MTTLLIVAFLSGFTAHIVVHNFQEFRHKRRQAILHKRAEKIKKEAHAEMLSFIKSMGGQKFIDECERQDMYDTVPLDATAISKPPKTYISSRSKK